MENKKFGEKTSSKKFMIAGLAVLIIFNLATIGYFTMIKNNRQKKAIETEKSLKLLNPARKLIAQDDLIVNIQPLRDELNKFEGDKNISIYFEFLNTGSNISVNKDAQFWPASLLKVPVAMAVAKKIETGEWKWENKLVLMAGDKDEKFGTLHKEPTGSTFTIEELVRRSLTDSDNTANYILVRNLELREIESVYSHTGMEDFFSAAGDIGAKKYSVIYRALYNSSYLSEENSNKLLSYLSQSKFTEYLQSGLPEGIQFSHKIGIAEEKGVYMDSGIVYVPNRPYLLTVMISGKDQAASQEIMKSISQQAFNYISNYTEK